MLVQAHTSTLFSPRFLPNPTSSRNVPFSHPNAIPMRKCCCNGVLRLNGLMNMHLWRGKRPREICLASLEKNSGIEAERKRKVVEHVSLLKAKKDLSDEEEKDMLDYLYTTQYQMSGVVAITLGRILDENLENYTHAVFMRFQRKEDLAKFYQNPFYSKVLKEHVMPYCHGFMNVDFESEVEDDILPIFRKGEEFNYGVEFVLLIAFPENENGEIVEDAMTSLARMTMKFPSLIVQSTQGSNFNPSNKEYTHGVVIRFRSLQAFEIFFRSPEYNNMWRSNFEPITQKRLSIHFSVDPVGTEGFMKPFLLKAVLLLGNKQAGEAYEVNSADASTS